jgi:hypothetical protein
LKGEAVEAFMARLLVEVAIVVAQFALAQLWFWLRRRSRPAVPAGSPAFA